MVFALVVLFVCLKEAVFEYCAMGGHGNHKWVIPYHKDPNGGKDIRKDLGCHVYI